MRSPAAARGGAKASRQRRGSAFVPTGVVVSVVVDTLSGNAEPRRDANQAQAEYYRRELSGVRARAESDLARWYIELQQVQDSDGNAQRPTYEPLRACLR